MLEKLSGQVDSRRPPLHVFLLIDTLDSIIANGKMVSINDAFRSWLPEMKKAARDNPSA